LFSRTNSEVRLPPPLLGQHSKEILSELGFDNGQITDFLQSKSVMSYHEKIA
jgi:crotonobetainyl-CoA:carnitine CoA-transferase CaiB-like acyl-CoA transferase